MNQELNDLINNQVYIINDIEYVRAHYIINNYGITTKRLKLWRDGKGQAKNEPLTFLKINNKVFLYSKKDIEKLILLTNHYRMEGSSDKS